MPRREQNPAHRAIIIDNDLLDKERRIPDEFPTAISRLIAGGGNNEDIATIRLSTMAPNLPQMREGIDTLVDALNPDNPSYDLARAFSGLAMPRSAKTFPLLFSHLISLFFFFIVTPLWRELLHRSTVAVTSPTLA